ncbi:CotH kinase family protein [Halocola ammonii]
MSKNKTLIHSFLTIISLAYFSQLEAQDLSDIQINEVCASNSSVVQDSFGEYDDWFELVNNGNQPVALDGAYIRITEGSDIDLHPINDPGGELVIEPGEFLLMWADGQPGQGVSHLDFSISSDGAMLELLDENQQQVSELQFDFLQSDVSKGVNPDDGTLLYYDEPTPGGENEEEGYIGQLAPPYFLGAGTFISGEAQLEIYHAEPDVTILFTTSGENPVESGIPYTSTIDVDPGDVVKAYAIKDDYLPSYINSRTFIEAQDLSLDIVSISGNQDDIFGSEGIYNNPYSGEEKVVSFEYYTADGNLQVQQNAGVKIHAPDGRSQKSMRLYARSEYGENTFEYQFFPQKELDEHKRLVLRNAGNDGLELNKTGVRDPLIHELFLSMNPDNNPIAGYRSVHVYLNGSYWGIYNLRERQDEFYIEYNYGYTSIDLIERTAQTGSTWELWEGSFDDFYLMEETAIELDLSQDENYQIITDWINIENFVDYQLTEIYIINQDWLSNNMKMWRPQDGSEKWRWILWDTDWGLGLFYPNYEHGYPDWNALNFALSNWGGWNSTVNTELLQNLVENDDFVWYFSSRGADLLNSHLKPETVNSKLGEITGTLQPDIQMQFDRWGGSVSNWEGKLDYVQSFVQDRPFFFRQHFVDRFELIDTHEITLERTPAEGGTIEVNTIVAETSPWEGIYYEALPVRLKAVPNPGYEFIGWEGIEESSDEIWVDLTSDSTFVANFEYIAGQTQPLVINEINYNSGEEDPGEWVEIYNPGPDTVNLNGWKFTDGSQNFFTFPEELMLHPDTFLILCSDTLLFQQVYPEVESYYGQFNFNLSNSGESPKLLSPFDEVMDEVTYSDSGQWPTEADGGGATLELVSPELDNSIATNWFARAVPLGSPGEHNIYDSVDEENPLQIIAKGFPNPASDRFNILVDVKKPTSLSIEVFDVFGKKVAEIGSEKNYASGVHHFHWNLQSAEGGTVPSGLYHIVIQTDTGRSSLRAIVAR